MELRCRSLEFENLEPKIEGWRLQVQGSRFGDLLKFGVRGLESVWVLGSRIRDQGFRVRGFGFRIRDSRAGVSDLGLRVQSQEFWAKSFGFRVQGLGFRV